MNSNKKFRRIISLLTVFILIASVNFVYLSKGASDKLIEDEAYYHDDFTDLEGIDDHTNCDINTSQGRITLVESQEPIPFDYQHRADSIDLFEADRLLENGLNQFFGPNLGSKVSNPKGIGTKNDGSVYEYNAGYGKFRPKSPIHHFRFKISREADELDEIVLKWWFGDYKDDASLEEIILYVWDYNSLMPRWLKLKSIDYNRPNINDDIDNNKNVNADLISESFDPNKEYMSDDGFIDVLILGKAPSEDVEKRSKLCTDYISLSITTRAGYVSQGTVTSELIDPDNLGQWDKVIFDGSKSSTKSNVTIEVLDKNNNLIEDFSSRSSPIDISSLNENKYKKIKLRATLRSSSIKLTPKLDSWTVLYQREDSFVDEFSSSFRIDELRGLERENKKINIDSYYGDWSIYGQTADNTRSFEGEPLTKKPTAYNWYTWINKYGGGFRAPVVSDGVVYVASVDNRIYSFNQVPSKTNYTQNPTGQSIDSYDVDSSLAISDSFVIFGTNSNTDKNKIYALNKNNLSKVAWSYRPNDNNIAFTSSPTIYDDYVIISSSSSSLLDTPMFSLVSSIIKGNNKLIVLDEANGDPIFEPIDLPAASHSTPAVGDEKIFVGCQNINGGNLFAFDLYTGEEAWNVSTGEPYGLIGKSSPVYADGKVFVTCNQKDSVFSSGKNMLMAIDASNGEVLWNKSIGVSKVSYVDLMKGIYTSAPVSSPSYFKDKLYIVSTEGRFSALNPDNGNEKWSYDLSNDSIVPGTYYASPTIIGNKAYVIRSGTIYCFDIDKSGKLDWTFELTVPDFYSSIYAPVMIYSSPVFSDGLLIISATHNVLNDLTGSIYTIGDYEKNLEGDITSSIIEVPNSHWWNSFSAETENINGNNSISFSILDENKNYIDGLKNLNGSEINISKLNTKKIRIFADFNVENEKEFLPVLDSWSLDWIPENKKPIFNVTTDKAWVNQDLPEYSVYVEDIKEGNTVSGLDISSARYRLNYIPKDKTKAVYSKWLDAHSDAESGDLQATITARISDSGLDIKELVNISFRISDLAGNIGNTSEIGFRSDTEKPTSYISNVDKIDEIYTSDFDIIVNATDNGGSNIQRVYLKYRYSNSSEGPWSNWTVYRSAKSIFNWNFGKDDQDNFLKSGHYNIISVAVDNANNTEEITDEKGITLLFDSKTPSIDSPLGEYSDNDVPISIDISDDFKLNTISYRTESTDAWEEIEENINKKTKTVNWNIPDEIWVDLEEEQEYQIDFKVTDKAGNFDEQTATIIKTKNESKTYLDLSEFSALQTDDKFLISLENIDGIIVDNAELYYRYSEKRDDFKDKNWTQFGETLTQAPYEWEFNSPNGNGYYKFYTKVKDTQGKTYVSSSEEVNIAVFPIVESILFFVLVFISIIISLFVKTYLKSRKETL